MSPLPAWSAAFEDGPLATVLSLPLPDVRDWAFGGATGAGVRVAVIDSGVDADHPRCRGRRGVAFEPDPTHRAAVPSRSTARTVTWSATARPAPAIIRSVAPEAEVHSVRVLGANLKGQGALLARGHRVGRRAGHGRRQPVSCRARATAIFGPLHELADAAYFARHGAGLRGEQPARPDLPLAVRLRRLGRGPRGQRPAGAGLQPAPAGRVRGPRDRRRGALGRTRLDRRDRQQLRRPRTSPGWWR